MNITPYSKLFQIYLKTVCFVATLSCLIFGFQCVSTTFLSSFSVLANKPTDNLTNLKSVVNKDIGLFLSDDLDTNVGFDIDFEEPKTEVKSQTKTTISKTPNSSISIPKIDLKQVVVAYSKLETMDDLYTKMDNYPVLETQYASDFCGKTAYLMGHSEPYYKGQKGSATHIFARLQELKIGDKIFTINSTGGQCVYEVNSWDTVTTNGDDEITEVDFNKLFNPVYTSSMLTIQTCKKGSSTVRLILRATQINL